MRSRKRFGTVAHEAAEVLGLEAGVCLERSQASPWYAMVVLRRPSRHLYRLRTLSQGFMSKLVGMMLHTALTTAGHSEFSSWDSHVDIDADDIIVTFHTANKYAFASTFRTVCSIRWSTRKRSGLNGL